MNEMKIKSPVNTAVVVEQSRGRQTPRPRGTFKDVLRGGAQILLSGARVATQLVGGPALSAAITGAGMAADSAAGQPGGAELPASGDPLNMMRDQRMSEELKLLALQDQIQRDSRQVALVSNVMKARHDTAKAAIGNIRS
jgi:hypothetical protein